MPTADSLGFVTTIGVRPRRPTPSSPASSSAPSALPEKGKCTRLPARAKIAFALGGLASVILAIVAVVAWTGVKPNDSASVPTTAYFTSYAVVGQAHEVNRSELNVSFDAYRHTYRLDDVSLRLRQGFYDAPHSEVFVFDPDSIVGDDPVVSGFLIVGAKTVPALFSHLERKQIHVHAHQAISPGLLQASSVVIAGASLPYRNADGQIALPHHSDSGSATYQRCTLTAAHGLVYISATEPMHRPFRYSSVAPFSITFSENFSWPLGKQWENHNIAIVPIEDGGGSRAAAIVRILNYTFTDGGGLSAWTRSLNGMVPTTDTHRCSMLIDSTETTETVQRFTHIVFELGRSAAGLSVITERCVGQIAIGAEKLCADNLASAIKSDLAHAEALLAYLGVPSIDGTLQTILDEAIDIAAGAYALLMGAIECMSELGFFLFPLPWPACVGELVMIGYEAYDVAKLIETIQKANFAIPPTVYTQGKYRGRSVSAGTYADAYEPFSFDTQLPGTATDPDGTLVRDLLVCRDIGRKEIRVYDKGCVAFQMNRRGVEYSEVASHSDYNCAFADCAHMDPIPIVFTQAEKGLGQAGLASATHAKVIAFLGTLTADDPWRAYRHCVHNITYASQRPKDRANANLAFKSNDGSYKSYRTADLASGDTVMYAYECMPVAVSANNSVTPAAWMQTGQEFTFYTQGAVYPVPAVSGCENCAVYGTAGGSSQLTFTMGETAGGVSAGCGIIRLGTSSLAIVTDGVYAQYDPWFYTEAHLSNLPSILDVHRIACFEHTTHGYQIYMMVEGQSSTKMYLELQEEQFLIATKVKKTASSQRWDVAFPSPPPPPPYAPAAAANVTCSVAQECTHVCCSMGSLQAGTGMGAPFYAEAQKWCAETKDAWNFCMDLKEGDYCGTGGNMNTGRPACGTGLYCQASLCRKRKPENATCGVAQAAPSWQSACEEALFCDAPDGASEGVCVKVKGTGAACSLDSECASAMCAYGGVASVCCENPQCNGVGCGNGVGYCKNQKTGGLCTDNGYCAQNYVCDIAAGAQQGTCSYLAPKAIGQPCDSNAECIHNMCAYGGTESVCCGSETCSGWLCGEGGGYCSNQVGGAPCADDGYCISQCNMAAGVCNPVVGT